MKSVLLDLTVPTHDSAAFIYANLLLLSRTQKYLYRYSLKYKILRIQYFLCCTLTMTGPRTTAWLHTLAIFVSDGCPRCPVGAKSSLAQEQLLILQLVSSTTLYHHFSQPLLVCGVWEMRLTQRGSTKTQTSYGINKPSTPKLTSIMCSP